MKDEEKAYNARSQARSKHSLLFRGDEAFHESSLLSYIAGFLDGDGSIMAQLVSRKDYKLRYQIRTSVVFYQKSTHHDFLLWLKEQLGYGYVRMRNDGMSEYVVVGFREVSYVLTLLYPFLRLKKVLASEVLDIIKQHPEQRKMTVSILIKLSKLVDKTASFNYSKKRTNTSSTVISYFEESIKTSP